MIKTFLNAFILCYIGISMYAHASVDIKFTSSYTNLSKDCRWAFKESQLQEGQDNSLTCNGYDAYSIQIDPIGIEGVLHINKGSEFNLDPSPIVPDSGKGMIEWRMANKRPFAIIVRSLSPDSFTGDTFTEKKEYLMVLGLKNYEFINYTVDVKNIPIANQQARDLADAAYIKNHNKKPTSTLPSPTSQSLTKEQAITVIIKLPESKAWSEYIERKSKNKAHSSLMVTQEQPIVINKKQYWSVNFYENNAEHMHKWESFLVSLDGKTILIDDANDGLISLEKWRNNKRPMARIRH